MNQDTKTKRKKSKTVPKKKVEDNRSWRNRSICKRGSKKKKKARNWFF